MWPYGRSRRCATGRVASARRECREPRADPPIPRVQRGNIFWEITRLHCTARRAGVAKSWLESTATDTCEGSAATFGGFGRVSPPGTPHGCSFEGGYVSCAVEKLQRGESWTMEFTVRPTAQGHLRQRVTVGGVQPDPAPANDSATVETTVIAREGALR